MLEESRVFELVELMEASRKVLHCGCKEHCFEDWRRDASNCLSALFGPDHPYTRFFRDRQGAADVGSLIAGAHVIKAALQQVQNERGRIGAVEKPAS